MRSSASTSRSWGTGIGGEQECVAPKTTHAPHVHVYPTGAVEVG